MHLQHRVEQCENIITLALADLRAFGRPISGCDPNSAAPKRFTGEAKVGVLHSRTGGLSISKNTVAEAGLMAIA